MRVVLDTNVLISALLSQSGAPFAIWQLWQRGKFDLLISHWQIAEVKRVLGYERVSKAYKISKARRGTLIRILRREAVLVLRPRRVDLSPDPDDNPLLSIAISGKAHYLVSTDINDILSLKKS